MNHSAQIKTTLDCVFSEVYDLYFKTHSCHWNVVAKDFHELHTMLQEQYTFLWNSLDEIAERYRVFEIAAPTTSIAVDASLSLLQRDELLKALLETQGKVIDTLKSTIETLEQLGDVA
jgi:starvation-inducible DNA-binding protein